MTEVNLEHCARYVAWFWCAGDLRCGGGWRQLDPVGEFSKPMARRAEFVDFMQGRVDD
jgi:hypothetical protein